MTNYVKHIWASHVINDLSTLCGIPNLRALYNEYVAADYIEDEPTINTCEACVLIRLVEIGNHK